MRWTIAATTIPQMGDGQSQTAWLRFHFSHVQIRLTAMSHPGATQHVGAPHDRAETPAWPLPADALLALAADWLWVMDAQFRLVRMARTDGGALPPALSDALGRAPWDHPAFEPGSGHWRRHRRVLWAHQRFAQLELGWRSPGSRRLRWCAISGQPLFGDNGHFIGYAGVAQDITARKRIEQTLRATRAQLSELAFYDALTGLPNRRLLLDRIEQALLHQVRAPSWCALLFVDLDDFKAINDRYGHAAGDAALVAVGERLRRSVRETDPVGRLGGDEFAALLPDLSLDAPTAQRIAQRVAVQLLRRLDAALPHLSHVRTPASVGVLLFRGAHALSTLLKQADELMYRAKGGGKGRWSLSGTPTPG
ncbi:putative diguanylate cyclase YdaM [Tepidimonas thermarum]|uniref:Putative diguanylate cyclase YdaM n=2 Tax=Tepidimonas thermarum TaxID=335431 RepID=A0A554X7P6_9BURK|nr:putative diguanylate cyclase YdaM [Tepidimonas thermarum]